MTVGAADVSTITLQGQPLHLAVAGAGADILFLSAGIWFGPDDDFALTLGALGRVTAPVHPGFDGGAVASHLTSADDLAYLYLDLVDQILACSGTRDVVVVAASFGAWVAAEMAVKSCERIAGLVLIGPAGVKAGGREDRDIVDLFAHPEAELVRRAFTEPERFAIDLKTAPEPLVKRRVEAREALARYVWQPYMHNPRLPVRLHRIGVPSLIIQGSDDRIVARGCAELYAGRIPGARLQFIDGAGHLPHLEQPEAALAAVAEFIETLPPAQAGSSAARARSSSTGKQGNG